MCVYILLPLCHLKVYKYKYTHGYIYIYILMACLSNLRGDFVLYERLGGRVRKGSCGKFPGFPFKLEKALIHMCYLTLSLDVTFQNISKHINIRRGYFYTYNLRGGFLVVAARPQCLGRQLQRKPAACQRDGRGGGLVLSSPSLQFHAQHAGR